jgi:elongation factor P
MILASQIRAGMAIRFEHQDYKVIAADYHPGQGKMGGVTHARLKNLGTGTQWEHSFRSELKLETLPLERQPLEFLYADGDAYYFMNPETYEQTEVPRGLIGEQAAFLDPGFRLSVEFLDGRPVSVVFPDIIEVRIADTAPAQHAQQDSAWKPARLDNGIQVMVPQFVKSGDMIRLDMLAMKYMDRVKGSSA